MCETQSVGAAQQALARNQSELVIIRDLHDRPIGVLTSENIDAFTAAHPQDWWHRRCAQAVVQMPETLGPEDSPGACAQYYREHGVRPVVIFDQDDPLGLLHPTEVFQWCAQHDDSVVEELAARARAVPHRQQSPVPAAAGGRP
ncbi:CBS domain-containing protein [Nesterenkonia halotolerans]|uniref:CBS domain-containing protein n=1 Tax=Nesterenkonia halotolerans TaxID=225325 RepID=A0ABR9J608_9MICC|nr:CBS domain-containing protein [Nesterenkonia halotolerans]MBE1514428.1 hypothetical protein [Nesterenkonia halotolerans]